MWKSPDLRSLLLCMVFFDTQLWVISSEPDNCIQVSYAENFSIKEASEGIYWVSVRNLWVGSEDEIQYCLVRKGTNAPDVPESVTVVSIPVSRTIALSTTYLANIVEIGETDSLIGVGTVNDINAHEVIERIKKKEVVEVGKGNEKNLELMISLEPDVVFTMAMGNPDHDIHPQLLRMGVPVALCSAWLERTALGRTEWIKYFAAFYDKLEIATAIFEEREEKYLELKELVKSCDVRPTVFSNVPWGGVWYVPGGGSYVAKSFEDAGGSYLWNDNDSEGSLALDFESVYMRCIDADFWINTLQYESLVAVAQSDERFSDFKALREGMVFNNTKRVNAFGGNDIWERGVVHPEEVLADLIKIFHPDLMPEHELIYYEQLD